jgi:hypothetical protein
MLRACRRLVLFIVIFSAGCAEPPSKEMNQAQGAIDAARAAGADRFAATEFAAATDALKRSEDAVAAGHAIDSRERAQNAAKLAVEGRADARGQAERAISEVATLLSQAQAQLKSAGTRPLRAQRAAVASIGKLLQEARAALAREDYAGVTTALDGAARRLQAALTQIDAAGGAAGTRRKR